VQDGAGALAGTAAGVRASLVRLRERLEAASERDPGNAELARALLEVLAALRDPDPEVF
jgi:hypothetical protein